MYTIVTAMVFHGRNLMNSVLTSRKPTCVPTATCNTVLPNTSLARPDFSSCSFPIQPSDKVLSVQYFVLATV